MKGLPELGANVLFDDSEERVEHLCKMLAQHQMPVARFFINTDFDRFDKVFRAAEKYRIKLMPTFRAPKAPNDEAMLKRLDEEIGAIVNRYKASPALDTWILLNEPSMSVHRSPLFIKKLQEWLIKRHGTMEEACRAWKGRGGSYRDFDDLVNDSGNWTQQAAGVWGKERAQIEMLEFLCDYHAWYMKFLAECVWKRDREHTIHTNPHILGGNLVHSGYDLPAWREFLDAMGATLHPGWSYGIFGKRERYALGFSYQCEMLRGSFEPKPFWITELQSGTNIYEANVPLCPLSQDMAQWTWVTIAAGAKRAVYWCLNPHRSGREAGGWGLLDYQDQPSDRIQTTGQIAGIINDNRDFFRDANPLETPITILLSLETMAVHCFYNHDDYPGRNRDAHIQAARGCYEALQEMGVPARIKHIHDFEWEKDFSTPQLLILPNVSALTEEQIDRLESFVKRGNTVLATGLTGMFGKYTELLPSFDEYPLVNLFGGVIKDMRFIDERFEFVLDEPSVSLPSHLFQGEIKNATAHAIARNGDWVTAVRNRCGEGEAIWIPSMICLGAWLYGNEPLAELLNEYIAPFISSIPFRFSRQYPGCLMRVMESGEQFLTVITNGTMDTRRCNLVSTKAMKPVILWDSDSKASEDGRNIVLGPRGTIAMLWRGN